MEVHAVIYHPDSIPDELFQHALQLVDADSRTRIKRFYHREDACRTLIGRLLAREMLRRHGTPLHSASLSTTETGKPYISAPELNPPIVFNISHDNAMVVMASVAAHDGSLRSSLGIDVMKVQIPRRQTLAAFLATVVDQLTPLEHRSLLGVPEEVSLRRFFWLWTMKEAYTKALGIGLGFDFRRVEYDIEIGAIRIDNIIPKGWRFSKFVLNDGDDLYQGVVAECTENVDTVVIPESQFPPWLTTESASDFVGKVIAESERMPVLST